MAKKAQKLRTKYFQCHNSIQRTSAEVSKAARSAKIILFFTMDFICEDDHFSDLYLKKIACEEIIVISTAIHIWNLL